MRSVGLDVHQKYTYYTEVDNGGAILRQGKVGNEALPALFADDERRRVVLEAARRSLAYARGAPVGSHQLTPPRNRRSGTSCV